MSDIFATKSYKSSEKHSTSGIVIMGSTSCNKNTRTSISSYNPPPELSTLIRTHLLGGYIHRGFTIIFKASILQDLVQHFLASRTGLFPLRQFPLCQFPLRQFPFGQLPTLSIPTLSIPIWSMLTKWELTKWELTKWEVDEVGKFIIV